MERKAKINDAREVEAELEALIQGISTDTKLRHAYQRLEKRLKREIEFLEKPPNRRGSKDSSNLPYLYGVFDVVKNSKDVQQIICDMRKYKIIIDVICDGGKTWKKVIARNPQSLHLVWASQGQYGNKDAVTKVCKYVEAAKKESDFSPPKVVCIFTRGVTDKMADYLGSMGVEVEGTREPVSADTLRRLQFTMDDSSESETSDDELDSNYDQDDGASNQPELTEDTQVATQTPLVQDLLSLPTDKKIFLDVTSMVIYVSDVCNGGADFEFKDKTMSEQAKEERITPTKPIITKYLEDRKIITCETALQNFKNFLDLLGGEDEKKRAVILTEKLTVVPDEVSERFQALKSGGKIKERAKIIFGTADRLRCNILTSNESFIRAAAAQGIPVSAIVHQSRALSELKRLEESSSS